MKSDTRNFDVCGQYLCTTGYTTRVFDLTSGKQLMEFSHGETVKTLSVIFKPGQELKSEASRIWIGNNIGELHEVDVATQSLVASNTSHNRREIVRILRYKKDLWSLDDEGKLFVWHADESGAPNLKYSHQAHRVARGHTFSMAVRDKLWLASGKEIRIYKPGSDSSFTILEAPLVQQGTGDITSGTYTSQQGGRAFLGHSDGKVTIYSIKDYACLGNVKVSDYKINGLAFAGDYLWAAYRTGKIYVYDMSTTPWTVKKDWRAHEGQVAGLSLDPSSIWTLGRLQVTSIGHDQSIRLWDGMLEEDWLESAMHEADIEYCSFQEIRASVITWNVGASNPLEVRGDFICDAIHVDDPPELLVFGFQEVVDLEDRAVTAKSILGFGKKKDTNRTDQHVSRVYREWRDYLAKCIHRYMGIHHPYSELHTSSLIGLFQCIFVRQDVRDRVHALSAADIKCGMKGHYGNKASTSIYGATFVLTS
jgi:WD40 repeat protein